METQNLSDDTNLSAKRGNSLAMTYGLATAIILIVVGLLIHFLNLEGRSGLQYLSFLIYIAAIILFCIAYSKQQDGNVTFGNIFGKAFRMVALVTIIMIAWGFLSNYIFPDMKEHAIEAARKQMEGKGYDEDKIDDVLEMTKKSYFLFMIMGMIFGFVFSGVIGALIGSLVAKKNNNRTPFQQ